MILIFFLYLCPKTWLMWSLIGSKTSKFKRLPSGSYRVKRVVDGDGFTVRHAGLTYEVRLAGIDAPELSQPYGTESRHFLRLLLGDSPVQIESVGIGKYGRTLAHVWINDRHIQARMLQAGMAWCYETKCEKAYKSIFLAYQKWAQCHFIGLFSEPNPIYPPDYRHYKRLNRKGARSKIRSVQARCYPLFVLSLFRATLLTNLILML